MRSGHYFSFGHGQGFVVAVGNMRLYSGARYQAPDEGTTLFNGDSGGQFSAARWEL
jgi:hypothetical protein